jgi:hypothetical protein
VYDDYVIQKDTIIDHVCIFYIALPSYAKIKLWPWFHFWPLMSMHSQHSICLFGVAQIVITSTTMARHRVYLLHTPQAIHGWNQDMRNMLTSTNLDRAFVLSAIFLLALVLFIFNQMCFKMDEMAHIFQPIIFFICL